MNRENYLKSMIQNSKTQRATGNFKVEGIRFKGQVLVYTFNCPVLCKIEILAKQQEIRRKIITIVIICAI